MTTSAPNLSQVQRAKAEILRYLSMRRMLHDIKIPRCAACLAPLAMACPIYIEDTNARALLRILRESEK